MKKYFHIPKGTVDETLRAVATSGIRQLEPLKTLSRDGGVPMNILEEVDAKGGAEVHEKEADLWLCLEGEPTFTLGGELVNARSTATNEIGGDKIDGGEDIVIKSGDWLWIPAGVPHQHASIGKTRMAIIKIAAIDK